MKGTIKDFPDNDIAQIKDVEVDAKVLDRTSVMAAKTNPGRNKINAVLFEGHFLVGKDKAGAVAVIDLHSPIAVIVVGGSPTFVDG